MGPLVCYSQSSGGRVELHVLSPSVYRHWVPYGTGESSISRHSGLKTSIPNLIKLTLINMLLIVMTFVCQVTNMAAYRHGRFNSFQKKKKKKKKSCVFNPPLKKKKKKKKKKKS